MDKKLKILRPHLDEKLVDYKQRIQDQLPELQIEFIDLITNSNKHELGNAIIKLKQEFKNCESCDTDAECKYRKIIGHHLDQLITVCEECDQTFSEW